MKNKKCMKWLSLFSQKNYQEALNLYEKILHIDPNNSNALGEKGAVFFKLGEPVKSLEYFDKAISINATNPYFLSDKDSVLLHIGQHTQAEKFLKILETQK